MRSRRPLRVRARQCRSSQPREPLPSLQRWRLVTALATVLAVGSAAALAGTSVPQLAAARATPFAAALVTALAAVLAVASAARVRARRCRSSQPRGPLPARLGTAQRGTARRGTAYGMAWPIEVYCLATCLLAATECHTLATTRLASLNRRRSRWKDPGRLR